MKCLEKDRTRRYETVHGLARDIERHLSDEPVHARPPSAAYRLKKFVRKHRVAVAAAAAVLGALAVGLALTAIGFPRRAPAAVASPSATGRRRTCAWREDLVSDVIRPAAEQMSNFPFTRDTQREVLEQARDFYEQILAAGGRRPGTATAAGLDLPAA